MRNLALVLWACSFFLRFYFFQAPTAKCQAPSALRVLGVIVLRSISEACAKQAPSAKQRGQHSTACPVQRDKCRAPKDRICPGDAQSA